MLRPVACLALALVAGVASADTPLWLARPEARPWRSAIATAADRSGLPPALIAELIGLESGFVASAKNAHSSARGCGQQINGNPYIARYQLDRSDCAQSILAAALQFADALERTGSLAGAAASYGTTAHLSAARRRAILARLALASRTVATEMVAMQVAPIAPAHGTVPTPRR